MKKIGITGGIGSGKTTVCEIFKILGIPVFHADLEAKFLQNNDLHIRDLLIKLFGRQIYSLDGILDRKKLARLIFNDSEALANVNSIIHPAVRQSFLIWANIHQDASYILYEAAILLESGYASDFDSNILVLADEKVRVERVIKRDHISEEMVMQRINNQLPDSNKITMVDYIIENSNVKLLFPQVFELDKLIRSDGKNW
ncbi:MAG TPA: dephospho-CoA kinase [Prolixibacteraceae bacterium]|nr:dephospho-CoA kinase [Prolixibacteraceae bacterium]